MVVFLGSAAVGILELGAGGVYLESLLAGLSGLVLGSEAAFTEVLLAKARASLTSLAYLLYKAGLFIEGFVSSIR